MTARATLLTLSLITVAVAACSSVTGDEPTEVADAAYKHHTAGAPDLVVTSVAWSPSTPNAGDAVTFSAVVKNAGNGATPAGVPITVGFALDGQAIAWTGSSASTLAAGASVTLQASSGASGSTWAATSGSHTIAAVVDDGNRIAESNEGNNTRSASLTVATTSPPPPPPPSGLVVGVNARPGSTTTNSQIASVMADRNLRVARMDYFVNSDPTLLRDQIVKINANAASHVQLIVENSYQWDGSCNSNLAGVEQDSYNQTFPMVGAIKDVAHDFEVYNEVQLFSWITSEVSWNTAGTSSSPYAGKPCVASVTAAIRGATRAIHDQGQRAIVGVIGRDFGWLSWLEQNGVSWDVTGYHIYPHAYDASLLSDPWFGAGGPLNQLASFGKPITINEFNCGEIYDSNYENTAGQPDTEQCMTSVNKHLQELRSFAGSQPIESVLTYELLDEPSKAAPESHFGLLYSFGNPKIELYLVTAYAGGNLTSTEQATITSRGLLTDAQIAAMK